VAPEGFGEVKEAPGGEGGEVAFGELGFDLAELLTEPLNAVGRGVEPSFAESLEVDGALVLDVILEFAAPFDEGGFGDFQFFGNAGETPTFAASCTKRCWVATSFIAMDYGK